MCFFGFDMNYDTSFCNYSLLCILHEVCVLRTCIASYKGMESKLKSKENNNYYNNNHHGPIRVNHLSGS